MYYIMMMGISLMLLTCNNPESTEIKERNTEEVSYSARIEKELPDFSFYTMDGKRFSKKDLVKGKPVIIEYFNPKCVYCQKETDEILSNIDQFENIQILMVTPHDSSLVAEFITEYDLNNYPQIKILMDREDNFQKKFSARVYPTLYLYNDEHEYIRFYEGYTDPEELVAAIRE